ncbi:MAG: polysaccharide biosynthesis tyrosine autokinase [Actinomycetota bacterium]
MNEERTSPNHRTDLREFLTVLRRRKLAVIGPTFVLTLTALTTSLLLTPIYAAEARVLVETPIFDPSELTNPTVPDMETEVQLARSPAVADLVVDRLQLADDVRALLDDLSTTRETDTRILVFRYAHPNPVVARTRTQAFGDAYLEFRRQQVLDDLLAASESIQNRIDSLRDELATVDERLAATVDSSTITELRRQGDSLTFQIAALEQQLGNLAPPDNLGVGLVVEPAQLPLSPASPNHTLNAVFALIVGFTLGIGLALVRERLDDRVRSHTDLEQHAGAPVLAVVPTFQGVGSSSDHPSLVSVSAPHSAASEAYRTLKTSFLFTATQRGLRTLLVTSPSSGEGKTVTASNLAVVLAQGGKRVVLVSADLRKPRVHELFNVSREPGLTSLLTRDADLSQASKRTAIGGLRVIPSGDLPGSPTELLASKEMGELIPHLADLSDFIILDCPPILPVSDALTLVPYADAVLLVADASTTTRSAIDYARERLDQVDAFILGAVLSNFDPSRASGHPDRYAYEAYYAPVGPSPSEEHEEGREPRDMTTPDRFEMDRPSVLPGPPPAENEEGLGGGFLRPPTRRPASSD